MNQQLKLTSLKSIKLNDWVENSATSPRQFRMFVGVSGYETRATYCIQQAIKRLPDASIDSFLVLGFSEYRESLSRPTNDSFYGSVGARPVLVSSHATHEFLSLVTSYIRTAQTEQNGSPLEIHLDYSCMPRNWYCNLPLLLQELLRPSDIVYFWYTLGQYAQTEFPTAGVKDFNIFSGSPSLSAKVRTHMFGLGFDRIRSQAIWSVLDPQNLICFYADPASSVEDVSRVKEDNHDILIASQHVFSVPIDDFSKAYSKIRAFVLEYRKYGDVILVPDGPKPIILATSLIPLSLTETGIVCFHVSRRGDSTFKPADTVPKGEPVGFCYQVKEHSTFS